MKYILLSIIQLTLLSSFFGQVNENVYFQKGSTVLSCITKDTIWIAADSKIVNTNVGLDTSFTTACKIHNVGRIFYAFTGSLTIYGKSWVDNIFLNTFMGHQYVTDSLKRVFELKVVKEIQRVLSDLYESKNPLFTSMLDKDFVTVSIYEFYAKYPKVTELHFYVDTAAGITIYPNDLQITEVDVFRTKCAGHCLNTPSFQLTDKNFWIKNKNNIKEALVNLINLEIKSDPVNVGGPVNVICIYKNGSKWLTNNKECATY